MKIKGFEKFQHYYLDKIWAKLAAGEDVPAVLKKYSHVDCSDEAMSEPGYAEHVGQHMHRLMSQYPAHDPSNGQWRTWGFVSPLIGQPVETLKDFEGEEHDVQALAHCLPGSDIILLCVEKRERVLPSSSIADKVFERVQAFEEREGKAANKKDWAILKDEVTATELTKAPIKRSRIWVVLWNRDCYVFTSSQKAAEETNMLIRTAFGSWPTIPAYVSEELLRLFFRDIMLRKDALKQNFLPGDKGILMNNDKEKLTITDSDLEETRYRELIEEENFSPIDLLFLYGVDEPVKHRVWARMNKKGDVKSFALGSLDEESDEGEGTELATQREKGSAGYDSKTTELWMLFRGLQAFSQGMYDAGVMKPRTDEEIEASLDGDEIAADTKPKAGGAEMVKPEEADDEGAWDDTPTAQADETPEQEEDDTWDMPPEDDI